jgi:hypothetical protein
MTREHGLGVICACVGNELVGTDAATWVELWTTESFRRTRKERKKR